MPKKEVEQSLGNSLDVLQEGGGDMIQDQPLIRKCQLRGSFFYKQEVGTRLENPAFEASLIAGSFQGELTPPL